MIWRRKQKVLSKGSRNLKQNNLILIFYFFNLILTYYTLMTRLLEYDYLSLSSCATSLGQLFQAAAIYWNVCYTHSFLYVIYIYIYIDTAATATTTVAVNIHKPELFYYVLVILLSFSANACSFPAIYLTNYVWLFRIWSCVNGYNIPLSVEYWPFF